MSGLVSFIWKEDATDKYLWDWKGGVKEGKSVSDIYNVYPIPDIDMNNNDNMTQNKGY